MQKFAVARYNFNSLFKEVATDSFIDDLMKEPYLEETNYSYAIGNIHTSDEEGYILTRGTFGRVKRGGLGEIYDKDKQEFISKELPEVADVMLEFLVSHKNHLIFVELKNRIGVEYFKSKFVEIYERGSSHGGLNVEYVFEEKDVYEEIEKWDRIDKVVLSKLRPSNPSTLPSFDNIEKLLKETGSQDTKIQFKAPFIPEEEREEESQAGLNPDSTLIKEGLSLSAHGYGEAKLTGTENGKTKEVESKRFLKKVEVDFFEEGGIKKIIETIEEITKDAKNT